MTPALVAFSIRSMSISSRFAWIVGSARPTSVISARNTGWKPSVGLDARLGRRGADGAALHGGLALRGPLLDGQAEPLQVDRRLPVERLAEAELRRRPLLDHHHADGRAARAACRARCRPRPRPRSRRRSAPPPHPRSARPSLRRPGELSQGNGGCLSDSAPQSGTRGSSATRSSSQPYAVGVSWISGVQRHRQVRRLGRRELQEVRVEGARSMARWRSPAPACGSARAR